MDEGKIIEVKRNILADNDKAADDFRAARAAFESSMLTAPLSASCSIRPGP